MKTSATLLSVALLVCSVANSRLEAAIVENFESYSSGTDLVTPGVPGGVGGWDTVNSNARGFAVADPVDPTNSVGYFRRFGSPATAGSYLPLGSHYIPAGTTSEFSVRFLFDANPNSAFGLSWLETPGPASGTGAGKQLSVLFRVDTSGGLGRLIYMTDQGTSTGPVLATSLTSKTWYQVWATVDNATEEVSSIYLQGGTQFPTKTLVNAGPLGFNQWAVDGVDTNLKTFFVFEQGYTAGIYLDDIQLQAIPEPATVLIWSLLAACGVGLAFWRRK